METTIAGIQAVESKDINTSKGPSTLYLIKDNVGVEYSTFTAELAQQAAAYKGSQQPALIGFEISTTTKPNKQGVDTTYTNRYLKSLSPAGEQQERTFVSTPQPQAPVASAGLTAPASGIVAQQTATEKDTAIARAVALKAAVDACVGGVNDFQGDETGVLDLAERYRGWLQGELSVPPLASSVADDDSIPF